MKIAFKQYVSEDSYDLSIKLAGLDRKLSENNPLSFMLVGGRIKVCGGRKIRALRRC